MNDDTKNDKSKYKKLLKLFFTTFYISAFTFGGGYVIVTLMKKKFVDDLHWIDEDEMLDLISIAQTSPGAVAVNASILVGKKICGVLGIAVAVLGTVLPPMITITVVSFFYEKFKNNTYISLFLSGMQSGIAAIIFDVVSDMGLKIVKRKNAVNIIIMAVCFVLAVFFKVNVILIIILAAAAGVITALIRRKKEKKI